MDLEEYKKLQQETELYRNNFANVNAEKIVIDKRYVQELQRSVLIETESLKKDAEIEKLKVEVENLKSEISILKAKSVEKEIAVLLDD